MLDCHDTYIDAKTLHPSSDIWDNVAMVVNSFKGLYQQHIGCCTHTVLVHVCSGSWKLSQIHIFPYYHSVHCALWKSRNTSTIGHFGDQLWDIWQSCCQRNCSISRRFGTFQIQSDIILLNLPYIKWQLTCMWNMNSYYQSLFVNCILHDINMNMYTYKPCPIMLKNLPINLVSCFAPISLKTHTHKSQSKYLKTLKQQWKKIWQIITCYYIVT